MSLRSIFEAIWNFDLTAILIGLAVIWAVVLIGGAVLFWTISREGKNVPKS